MPLTTLSALLGAGVARGASGIHLKPASPPLMRVHGRLTRVDGAPLSADDTEAILAGMLARLPTTVKQDAFDRVGEVDFAHADEAHGRFRVTAYRQRGAVSLVLRPVPDGVPPIEALGLPEAVGRLADEAAGLVVVAGPVGSGVTTTLAALVDAINRRHERNVITIEDPIEVLHRDLRGAVSQREVGLDTPSFAEGLSRIARQDPDVVLVGEVPDAETVEAALAAADGGVLVLCGVRSTDASEAVARLVGMVPGRRQSAVRAALAASLRGIVVQHLLPRADGDGRVPAAGVLLGGADLRHAVSAGLDPGAVAAVARAGRERGMVSLDDSLAELVSLGRIEVSSALRLSSDPTRLHQPPDLARVAALLEWEDSED